MDSPKPNLGFFITLRWIYLVPHGFSFLISKVSIHGCPLRVNGETWPLKRVTFSMLYNGVYNTLWHQPKSNLTVIKFAVGINKRSFPHTLYLLFYGCLCNLRCFHTRKLKKRNLTSIIGLSEKIFKGGILLVFNGIHIP